MERNADFLGQYRNISGKLKKRFMKKPNVSDGSKQFGDLAKVLQIQECPSYAGLCCLAQARCEQTLVNAPGEAQSLTDAARDFLEADSNCRQLHCPGIEDHLTAAINCYNHAIRVHIENKHPALAATLCLEVGNALKALGKPGEAMAHYQRAAELQFQNPLDCLYSLGKVASCKIEIGDHEGALSVLTEVSCVAEEQVGGSDQPAYGAIADILAKCQLDRVLLLMLLQPPPQRIRPEHARILEKYSWPVTDEDMPSCRLPHTMFLLMQSVVMACQSRDIDSLNILQVELWSLLNSEQNQLLHMVIQEMAHPSGQEV